MSEPAVFVGSTCAGAISTGKLSGAEINRHTINISAQCILEVQMYIFSHNERVLEGVVLKDYVNDISMSVNGPVALTSTVLKLIIDFFLFLIVHSFYLSTLSSLLIHQRVYEAVLFLKKCF